MAKTRSSSRKTGANAVVDISSPHPTKVDKSFTTPSSSTPAIPDFSQTCPSPPPSPRPSKWRCCRCGTRYHFSTTRRCIHDGHLFCLNSRRRRVERLSADKRLISTRARSPLASPQHQTPLPESRIPGLRLLKNSSTGTAGTKMGLNELTRIERNAMRVQAKYRRKKIKKREGRTCHVTFHTPSWKAWNIWRRTTPSSPSPSSPFSLPPRSTTTTCVQPETILDCTISCDYPGECRRKTRTSSTAPAAEEESQETTIKNFLEKLKKISAPKEMLIEDENLKEDQHKRKENEEGVEQKKVGEQQDFQTWMRKWGLDHESSRGCSIEEWLERSEKASKAWELELAEMDRREKMSE